jgi:hypothetical protein
VTAFTLNNSAPAGANGAASLLSWASLNYGNSTSARYLHSDFQNAAADANEIVSQGVVTGAGTLRNLFVGGDTALGGGNSVTYTMRINGVDTALTATLTTGVQLGSDTTHSVSAVAGDAVAIQTVTATANSSSLVPSAVVEYAP